jgi:hypothetical protein
MPRAPKAAEAPPVDELDEEYELTETARYEVQLGATFTHRGLSHWPKVVLSDSMMIVEGEDGALSTEGQESLVYRVEHVAHARLDAVIARMKRDIDERYASDQAQRQAAAAAATPEADDTTGETA